MNQTRQEGFTQVQSAFAFIKSQVENHNKRQLARLKRRKAILKRFASTVATVAIVTAVQLPHLQAQEATIAEAQLVPPTTPFESTIQLDKESYSLLVVKNNAPQIAVGKSLAQEQAEERARQLAAAQAQARAQSQEQSARQPASTVHIAQKNVGRIYADNVEEAHRLAKEAAAKAGIPDQWKTLVALWVAESGKTLKGCINGGGTAHEPAVGPLQFLPSTYRKYATDGNGDGVADICNAEDALVAAGKLLKSNGVEQDADKAIFAYNHSRDYVAKINRVANSINN